VRIDASKNWIAFNRPYMVGTEMRYMHDAVLRGHVSGDGWYTKRCQEMIERVIGAPSLLTTSCTHALEMTALLLELGPGDEVIVPSFTFVSTANAFALRGASVVFADVRPDTLNLDERFLEQAITQRTRAIVVVHYAGVSCDMDSINAIARRRHISVIEDNAHGFGGSYRGRPLGSLGTMSALSFHETKNVHCGEGGALVINSKQYVPLAEILREKGTNRSQFFRGAVDKYTWVGPGSSYLPSDLLGAFLFGQLEALESIQTRRLEIWKLYLESLVDWADREGFRLPVVPPHVEHPAHLFYVLMPDLATRTAFIEHMAAEGVHVVFHYVPLHTSPQGRRLGGLQGSCPVAEEVSDRLVRLPLHAGLTALEVERVVAAALSFRRPAKL
jgi:dTDP-4-amino-4,6-dideoxygalactose transaminase